MSSDNVFNFTTENFQAKVLEANRPVLVFFWATWNSSCRDLQPHVEKLANNYTDKLKVGRVDVDSNQQISITYGVQSVPMCLLFKGGVVVAKLVGYAIYERLEIMVKPYI